MKPQRDKLEQLRRDIKGMEEKFVKEAAAMSERDKKALREQADQKANEFNTLIAQVQKRTQDAQQDLLNRLLPSMQAVLEDMRKAGNFDIIMGASKREIESMWDVMNATGCTVQPLIDALERRQI